MLDYKSKYQLMVILPIPGQVLWGRPVPTYFYLVVLLRKEG